MRRKSRAYPSRKALGHEQLESRNLLAGIVDDALCSPWQNPLDANDLNTDGVVTAADALVAINSINAGVSGDLSLAMAPPTLDGIVAGAAADYLDASGDGYLSAADALAVINVINQRLPGGPIRNLPLDDQHGDTTTAANVGTLEFGRGFAKVLAAINSAADVDVFKIEPTKSDLNVSLFSANRVALTVSVVVVDALAPGGVETLATATTEAGSRRPAKINLDLDVVPGTYFLIVGRAPAPTPAPAEATDEIAVYGLGVLNYSAEQFRPITDSELGDDKHDGPTGTPTPLALNHNHAQVRSNIDPVAEGSAADVDSFIVDVKDGKLIVHARAEFPLSLEIVRLDEPGAEVLSSTHRVISSVTAGRYMVSVKAENGADVGPYRLNIVNAPIPRGIPHDPDAAVKALFARLDSTNDDLLTKEELTPVLPLDKVPVLDRIFNDWDADNDGALDFAEFEANVDDLHRRAAIHTPVRDFISRLRRR